MYPSFQDTHEVLYILQKGYTVPGFQGTHDVYMLTKGYTVPGNQGTHDKLNQIRKNLMNKGHSNDDFNQNFSV